MQELDAKIQSKNLYKAFDLIKQKKFDEAQNILDQGLKEAEALKDLILAGIYYSTQGILYKLKKDFRKSWKCYEKAERLIPDDPALKIISSKLLVDYFGQYDTAIKKMDKVIESAKEFTPFLHMARTVQGLAYLRKGNHQKTKECLELSMVDHFNKMESAANLDFDLVKACLKKKLAIQTCQDFLQSALQLAKSKRETTYIKMIQVWVQKVNENF